MAYFAINEDTGDISIRDDLTKEIFDEYKVKQFTQFCQLRFLISWICFQLDIQAYDLGTPPLSTVLTLVVRVRQVVTQPPDSGVGFVETAHFVQTKENMAEGTVLKTLELDQKERSNGRDLKIECKIVRATDQLGRSVSSSFIGRLNAQKDCELVQGSKSLDREQSERVTIEMKLRTLSAFTNPAKKAATVRL